ncbi:MAG TPA: hypothetical protein VND83_02280 [Acidimicrobiales bacterium]|nr:hypothetical protein [Acidimicrobiales bacterium]
MTQTRGVLAHLGSCFTAPYRVLGAAAGTFSDDGAVVRSYETARVFGELALATRERLGEGSEPLEVLLEVLDGAVEGDPTGRLALYCVAVVVGPRLLVSLRDARDVVDDDARGLIDHASDLVVAEIIAIRELASAREDPDAGPGPGAVRALNVALEGAGFAESFGVGG